jgi:hypothetical protein
MDTTNILSYYNSFTFRKDILYCIVFIFQPRNHYKMISDTSKKEDLQKRERERERKKEST